MNQSVSSLNLPKSEINKLEASGFYTVEDVKANKEVLKTKINLCQWDFAVTAPKPKTALQLLIEESKFRHFNTNISELDTILKPLIISGSVTEFCGLPGSGRTQICLHLAVGAKGEVVFIHTNKNLNLERLKELCNKYNAGEDSLHKMLCIEVTDCVELLASITYLDDWLKENHVKFVIIDSISWPVKQLIATERSTFIYDFFQKLRSLARTHNFAVIVTNDLTTRISESESSVTPSLGHSLYHVVNNRILLSKSGSWHKAEIQKNLHGCQETVSFQI